MCKLKSAIILKDRIFIPDYDSHSKMLDELGIQDDYLGASKKFVRAELSPINNDVFSDIASWKFAVDQDIVPEWFTVEEYKPKMVEAVKEWAKTHIHIGVNGLKISTGTNHYIKDCKDVNICDSATVENICGSATVKSIYGSATVESIYDSAKVKYICDSATVKNIYGSATVENIYDSATVMCIYDSATVEDIYGSATVKYVYGSATVESIYGSAKVKYIYGSATVKNIYGSAMVVSSPCKKWLKADSLILAENATFKDNYGKVIYQSGDYKLISVKSGEMVCKV